MPRNQQYTFLDIVNLLRPFTYRAKIIPNMAIPVACPTGFLQKSNLPRKVPLIWPYTAETRPSGTHGILTFKKNLKRKSLARWMKQPEVPYEYSA